jgi:hypothetical protein
MKCFWLLALQVFGYDLTLLSCQFAMQYFNRPIVWMILAIDILKIGLAKVFLAMRRNKKRVLANKNVIRNEMKTVFIT